MTGRRFMREMASYSICRYLDPNNAGITTPIWEERTLREKIAVGIIINTRSIAELAGLCGIDAASLQVTVATYDEDCAAGSGSHFFKKSPKSFSIGKAPFDAVEVRAAIIGGTGAGGIRGLICRSEFAGTKIVSLRIIRVITDYRGIPHDTARNGKGHSGTDCGMA